MSKNREIIDFMGHLDESTEEFIDALGSTRSHGNQFDYVISVAGKSIELPNSVEMYCLMNDLLSNLITEYYKENEMRIRRVAELQSLAPERLQISFKYYGRKVTNPFQGLLVSKHKTFKTYERLNPLTYYGKAFLKSGWMDEEKVRRLEVFLLTNGLLKPEA